MATSKTLHHEQIIVPADGARLQGDLSMPEQAAAIVLFAHGSGSSRRSPRNRTVADGLHAGGFGTLLFDLLTENEQESDDRSGALRFDIDLLTSRLNGATDWLETQPAARDLPVGLFGASTGAAAALGTAADRAGLIGAVVSRGGRPDLAADALPKVKAPTLLIVGGRDEQVIQLNRQAANLLEAKHQLEIVPEAGHLFEEPGKLEEVARLTRDWFAQHLAAKS